MATARITEGSQRVSVPKRARTANPATIRLPSVRRRRRGAATASTKATFWPDTTSRWVRPEARKS
jgi:hypothetical protein